MSWEKVYALVVDGNVPALETYLDEHKELGHEDPGRAYPGIYNFAVDTMNRPILETLTKHFPLTREDEWTLALRMVKLGQIEPLALLRASAAAYGALYARDPESLRAALARISRKDVWSLLAIAIRQPRERGLFGADLILEHIRQRTDVLVPKVNIWNRNLTEVTENYSAAPGQAALVQTLLNYGGRLAPNRQNEVLRRIMTGMNQDNLGPDNVRLLRTLYDVGYGVAIPPHLQERVLQDAGRWVLLRHPRYWIYTDSSLAQAAEEERSRIARALLAAVGTNLSRYILRAL